jgi:hypothetical protein
VKKKKKQVASIQVGSQRATKKITTQEPKEAGIELM